MSKQKHIANRILKRATEIQDGAYNYFAKHKILNGGDDLRREEKEPYVNPSHVVVADLELLAKHASSLVDKELMKFNVNAAKQSAVELAVKTFSDGKYDGKIGSVHYYQILNLMNSTKVGGEKMKRTAQYYTKKLDTVANDIRKLVKAGLITANDGFALEMALDEVSDALEGRTAKKLEGDADEKYMNDFGKDPATKQQDADESYMKDFHNGGQNIMSEALAKGEFKPEKKVASLNANALAAKRK